MDRGFHRHGALRSAITGVWSSIAARVSRHQSNNASILKICFTGARSQNELNASVSLEYLGWLLGRNGCSRTHCTKSCGVRIRFLFRTSVKPKTDLISLKSSFIYAFILNSNNFQYRYDASKKSSSDFSLFSLLTSSIFAISTGKSLLTKHHHGRT